MKRLSLRRFFLKGIMTPVISSMAVSVSSCDSMIYDGPGDCSVHYMVSLRYTRNILNADAFGPQVTEISLALYDKDGNMALHKTEHREPTTENNFHMEVDVPPGTYDILAWCEGESPTAGAVSFMLSGQEPGSSLWRSGASLPLMQGEDGLYSGSDINRLYHGISRGVTFPASYGTVDIPPVSLTKDTNHITISLQNVDGSLIDPANLEFRLEAANSSLNWKNEIEGDTRFTYTPWAVATTTATTDSGTKADSGFPNGVRAEITTGRIMADREQALSVKRKDTGETIFRIPLVEYLLLVRGEYEQATSDQDYLDRFDDFSMVFFMQDGYTWVKSRILINGWRVVPPQNQEF